MRRLIAPLVALVVAGCGQAVTTNHASRISVVAAENFWGSLAAQVGGSRVAVHSIVVDPNQDPHSYSPTASDARTLATAQLVIANGIGYDPWVKRLLAANPVSGRALLDVGALVGAREGANPHVWYSPADVKHVAAAISAELGRIRPAAATYFDAQLRDLERHGLAEYDALVTTIRERYAGTSVGASESIFGAMAPALGLNLETPGGFMRAISEGTDVTAQDELTTERQIDSRAVRVWVYNRQNQTPLVQRLTALARARGIPIVTITETLDPAGASFKQWQVAQLGALERALHLATGH